MSSRVSAARRATLLGGGAVAAVLAVAAAATIATSAQASAGACATSGLVVWLNTSGNGAAGSIYYNLEFTNLGGRACTLYGYPGASAVDLAGSQLGRAASRDAVHPAKTVTLADGATAHAVLRIVEAGNYPRSACAQRRPSILSVETVQNGPGSPNG